MERNLVFKYRNVNNKWDRYWWHKNEKNNYIPPIFSFLNDDEWKIMNDWFDETDVIGGFGECNVPMMSVIQGLVMGNGVGKIIETGTFFGYSSLLIGFMMKRMNKKNSFITIDISQYCGDFLRKYVDEAQLNDYVKVVTASSSDAIIVQECLDHLGGSIDILFIDSSHQYQHTLDELDLWYKHLSIGGFVILHDTSEVAIDFDSTGQGGVIRALDEWVASNSCAFININKSKGTTNVYQDGCGLGIIQKI